MTADASRIETIDAIHDHLAATAELPVDRSVTAYLGEAEAVAEDATRAIRQGQAEAARTRIEQVVDLLSHVDETGHAGADEHVEAAQALALPYLESENDD